MSELNNTIGNVWSFPIDEIEDTLVALITFNKHLETIQQCPGFVITNDILRYGFYIRQIETYLKKSREALIKIGNQ